MINDFRAALGAYRTPISDKGYESALAYLEAMARRDWAVRVLDLWAIGERCSVETRSGSVSLNGPFGPRGGLQSRSFYAFEYGGSRDEARLAAARAAWADLAEDEQSDLGVCP